MIKTVVNVYYCLCLTIQRIVLLCVLKLAFYKKQMYLIKI
jgi:hypothetical protein